MFETLLSATTVTAGSSWCIPAWDSSFPFRRLYFLPLFSFYAFLFWRFLHLAHERALSPFYLVSPFKLLFKIPLLHSHSVWEEGSRLNGSQRGPWTSRGETLDLAQALNHPQISLLLSQGLFPLSPRLSLLFFEPICGFSCFGSRWAGPGVEALMQEWMWEMDSMWVGVWGSFP